MDPCRHVIGGIALHVFSWADAGPAVAHLAYPPSGRRHLGSLLVGKSILRHLADGAQIKSIPTSNRNIGPITPRAAGPSDASAAVLDAPAIFYSGNLDASFAGKIKPQCGAVETRSFVAENIDSFLGGNQPIE